MIESSLNVIEPSKEMLSELFHSEEKEEEVWVTGQVVSADRWTNE